MVDGAQLARQTFPGPGSHKLVTPPASVAGESATVAIEVDRTFSVPGDQRTLGVILVAAGFR
ncbi:MAG: hypothetical protein HY235_00255 [Acidobacteria bacterium]|nr:hypothetical protein [Acidobacteriota bacterium]